MCRCFFFNDTATTEIYTLSLHDALPIYDPDSEVRQQAVFWLSQVPTDRAVEMLNRAVSGYLRSEEHTSELQSQSNLVCRLLLEKKKTLFPYTYSGNKFFARHNHLLERSC